MRLEHSLLNDVKLDAADIGSIQTTTTSGQRQRNMHDASWVRSDLAGSLIEPVAEVRYWGIIALHCRDKPKSESVANV